MIPHFLALVVIALTAYRLGFEAGQEGVSHTASATYLFAPTAIAGSLFFLTPPFRKRKNNPTLRMG